MANTLNITDTELARSAVQFRTDLLIMPVISAKETLGHMTGRPGTRGRVVVGELSGDVELGPYDPRRKDDKDLDVKPRTLETFLGSVVKEFDPNSVWRTIYGSLVTQGEALKNVNVNRYVLSFMAGKLGKSLNKAIWTAKRNDAGTTTADLFDGFDTITEKEIADGGIAADKGNLYELAEDITNLNAVDSLKSFYEAASDELQSQTTKLYMPRDVYNAYVKDYQSTVGAVPYNTQYKKTFLEGTGEACELVPLSSKRGSKFLTLTTQGNMLYGYGDGLADEKVTVEKHDAFLCQFIATMYFGCQFETVSPERLIVARKKA